MISIKPRGKGYSNDFVESILTKALALPGRCPVFAIAGLQGTGKSTLAAQLAELALRRGITTAVLSIDDFYLTHAQRQTLGRDVHPLLATRGPPGTHDIVLACECIDQLRSGTETAQPQFDKIADDRINVSLWPTIKNCDLIIFEGWFLKVPAQPDDALSAPINSLERNEDPQNIWRHYCNQALKNYAPLWQRLDYLLFLQGPGFEQVLTWRSEQEKTLQAGNPGRKAMSHAQIARFILFFERISRHALQTLPALADTTIRLNAQREPLI